jgi:anaerobic selenocysteine-containing dehydrogenase
MNRYDQYERILRPRIGDQEVSLEEVKVYLADHLKSSDPQKVLFYKSAGNFGKVQDATSAFFAKYGAYGTHGSLCDGAGQQGVLEGRGGSYVVPPDQIAKSEVVILWGRNPSISNRHFVPLIKDKQLIVIDPIAIKLAKKADLFIQIKPRDDIYLATLLTSLLKGNDQRVDQLLKRLDVSLDVVQNLFSIIQNKKTVILVGTGVQKYAIGDQVLQAIDSFASALGLFGKEGCGVSYLGSTGEGFRAPFSGPKHTVSTVNTPFEQFDTIFFQGANPLSQMPNSQTVIQKLEGKKVIYFGLYENETSARADMIIPAQTFLEKDDIRLSYSSNDVLTMPKVDEAKCGISEHQLYEFLYSEFGFGRPKRVDEAIKEVLDQCRVDHNGYYTVANRSDIPYKGGLTINFDLGKVDDQWRDDQGTYFVVQPKSKHSLNSQFRREHAVFVHPESGFEEGREVRLTSAFGEAVFQTKYMDGLRKDCVCIYSGTPMLNYLTPYKMSNAGQSAMFQELKVTIRYA